MDFVYYAPDGSSWESPDVDEIVALIESAGPQYWEFQSATAGLVCLSDGTRTSEMVIMVDGDAGSMLRFCPSGGEDELILTHPGREREEDEVVVYPGGEEWVVPRRYFGTPEDARAALGGYMATGTLAWSMGPSGKPVESLDAGRTYLLKKPDRNRACITPHMERPRDHS